MTPKFNIVKRGYDPDEVDRFIDEQQKIIDEYKKMDQAIKNAIVNAQIAADGILDTANAEAEKMKANTMRQLTDVKNSISTQKQLVDEFKYDYNLLIKQYITDFNGKRMDSVYDKISQLESYFDTLKTNIYDPEQPEENK